MPSVEAESQSFDLHQLGFFFFLFCCAGSWGFLAAHGLSLVVCRLLAVLASLFVEHELQAHMLQRLHHLDLVVVAYGLSCPAASGIFLDQGWNPCPLHWQADSFPLYHQGCWYSGFETRGAAPLMGKDTVFIQQQ